ncbi:MAG: MarR family winged helix-turn-helix transcriptional regulator [Pseudomonadota bacterium]
MTKTKKKHAPLTVTRPELLIDGDDAAFREMVHAALAFAARLTAVRDGYAEFVGLPGPQYTILVSIQHLKDDGSVSVKRIADHLRLSGTFVTTETNKLVRKGLVLKEKDPNDGRRVSLKMTKDGDDLLNRLSEVQQQVNDAHFGALSKKEFEQLRKIMPELVDSTDVGLSLLSHLTAKRELSGELSLAGHWPEI